ncbi:MAG: trypsin-like peptidase domain-containing protein [Alphaproteobacteria bacterium]|nr:trypsin-like peptidase domain-containing protein [Alphaproteobacteria bacterium]
MTLCLDDYVITFMGPNLNTPKCSGFALNERTIVTCAHCNVDPNIFVYNRGQIRTLPRKRLWAIEEDLMFLTSGYSHGFAVIPHAVPSHMLGKDCYVVPQYRAHDKGPRPCNKAEVWDGPQRKWMRNESASQDVAPMIFPYHFHDGDSERDVRAFGSSGSPVVNTNGELLGMHCQSDWQDGMGFAVPLFQIKKAWQKVKLK